MTWSRDEQLALGQRMRDALREELRGIKPPVGVLLSAGMDSLAVLAVVRDLVGVENVRAYSFTLEDRESGDLRGARRTAEHLGVPFSVVQLSTDLDQLLISVKLLIASGVRGKTGIECSWPMRAAIKTACADGYRSIATGAAADGHFALSKAAMIHHRHPLEKLDAFREAYFGNPDKAQVSSTREWAARRLGVEVRAPWHSPRMCAVVRGVPWDALNKPRQKEPLRLAFAEEMPGKAPPRHTNLQLGDSGIAELFARLAEREGASSPVALYNRLGRIEDSRIEDSHQGTLPGW